METKNFQNNLNTVFLGLAVTGICWIMKDINDLDSKMAASEAIRTLEQKTADDVNRVLISHSTSLGDQDNRITRLETIVADQKKH